MMRNVAVMEREEDLMKRSFRESKRVRSRGADVSTYESIIR